jgi:PIN domain nuclease of toxin-antitoxin system
VAVAYLDTNVAIWLRYGKLKKISKEARRVIEARDLLISPMVYLEFDNVLRLGRVRHSAAEIYSYLNSTIGLTRCQIPFATVAELAGDNLWTTDPFDKIIVAQAQANHNAPLITSDGKIAEHYAQAVW